MAVITPNMNLPKSIIGTSTGLEWETNLNVALDRIDAHDHSVGQGTPITPNGLDINQDLSFNNNSPTSLFRAAFQAQPSALDGTTYPGCIYASGVDLWYNDVSGRQIQLTSGGSVNATSSGISDGTASASFISSVLVVTSDTNKPANVKAGSILIGNNVTSSHYLTLAPPNAMATDYRLTLPSLPGATSILTLDTSGNIVAQPFLTVSGSNTMIGGTLTVTSTVEFEGNMHVDGDSLLLGTLTLQGTILSTPAANTLSTSAQKFYPFTSTYGGLARNTSSSKTMFLLDSSGNSQGLIVSSAPTSGTSGSSIVWGIVNGSSGAVVSGGGFTCTPNGSGTYTITYTTAYGFSPAIMVTALGGSSAWGILSSSTSGCQIQISTIANTSFHFMAIGGK